MLVALTAGLLMFSLTPAASAETTRPATVAAVPATVAAPGVLTAHTVTLVTGDRVTVMSDGNLALDPTRRRDGSALLAYTSGGHQYVIPSDALGLIRDGRLDRRLFDVTLLRELGYDDRRGDLPLIVTGRGAVTAVQEADGQTDLPAVEGVAARVDQAALGSFWDGVTDPPGGTPSRTLAAGVSAVWLDGLRQPVLDESVPQIGAPAAHAAGLDGTGATVAVLDTGIDLTHPDLAEQVVASANFTSGEDDRDLSGHGTHVSSILAGTGAAAGGQFRGVAPGASLLNGKVCTIGGCADSWILAGMQWAAEQGADVVNMSLGVDDEPGLDPVEQAVERLTVEFGTLFVVSAGNRDLDAPVSSPASADAAVAVGAVDKADQLAPFTRQGPSVDGTLKPDITAPGAEITAAASKDGALGEPGKPYTTLGGTSMSAPHVAGAAAILVQQHPEWTPAQLKAGLMGSAAPNPELGPYAQGAGRLDIARAITQTVTADPPSVGFDVPPWPHDDDEPQTRTVSYVNGGDTDLTLELAMTATAPDGQPAPDGFFTLEATTVTVPAGGSADATLTADTSVGEVDGFFGGYLTALGPDAAVTTPFAVDREVETYNLTLPHADRDGAPTTDYLTMLIRLDGPGDDVVFTSPEAAPTVRLPAGEYTLMSKIPGDEESLGGTLLAYPRLVLDHDQTVAVDARLGRPISVTVPDPSAAPTSVAVSANVATDGKTARLDIVAGDFDNLFSGQLGSGQTFDGFASSVVSAWAQPDPEGGFAGTPYTYDLAWFQTGGMVTGFARDVKPRDLATVRASFAAHVPGVVGERLSWPVLPGLVTGFNIRILPERPPFRRTEYYNTDGGGMWINAFAETVPGEEDVEILSLAETMPTAYRAGGSYQQQWNRGVFGPVLPDCGPDVGLLGCSPVVSRLGDELTVAPLLYGDSAGRQMATPAVGATTVYRNGEQIADVPELFATVGVPAGSADYRVEAVATRDERFPLAASTSVAWTFRSGYVDGEEPVPLPVSVVRFTPRLDQHNTAPAGRTFLIPVEVQPQPGSAAAGVRRLSVEVSFDDGDSWHQVPVLAGRYALVDHPAGDGFVSLRASATDRAGNAVEQTVIRAYALH